jgi:hypothetical protein
VDVGVDRQSSKHADEKRAKLEAHPTTAETAAAKLQCALTSADADTVKVRAAGKRASLDTAAENLNPKL